MAGKIKKQIGSTANENISHATHHRKACPKKPIHQSGLRKIQNITTNYFPFLFS